MNFLRWLGNNVITITQTVSIVIASCTAIYGISSWRREAKGRKILDLSEKTLALFYEAKDNIRSIRNPGGFIGEGSTREKASEETAEETKILNKAYAVVERYNKMSPKFNELFSLKYPFMAVFGKKNGKYFDDLRNIINEIFIASNMLYIHYRVPGDRNFKTKEEEQKFLKEFQEQQKLRKVIWDVSDDDEINKRINNIIAEIEKVCESASRKI